MCSVACYATLEGVPWRPDYTKWPYSTSSNCLWTVLSLLVSLQQHSIKYNPKQHGLTVDGKTKLAPIVRELYKFWCLLYLLVKGRGWCQKMWRIWGGVKGWKLRRMNNIECCGGLSISDLAIVEAKKVWRRGYKLGGPLQTPKHNEEILSRACQRVVWVVPSRVSSSEIRPTSAPQWILSIAPSRSRMKATVGRLAHVKMRSEEDTGNALRRDPKQALHLRANIMPHMPPWSALIRHLQKVHPVETFRRPRLAFHLRSARFWRQGAPRSSSRKIGTDETGGISPRLFFQSFP